MKGQGPFRRSSLVTALALLALLGFSGCRKNPPSSPQATFEPLGLEISGLPAKTPVTLYDSSGRLLLSYPPLPGENILLVFPWRPGETYRLEAGKISLHLRAPKTRPLAEVEVFAPLGSPGKRLLIFAGGTPGPREFVIFSPEACPEVGFLITSFVPRLRMRLPDSAKPLILSGEFARKFFRKRLCLSPGTTSRVVLELGHETLVFSFRREVFDLRGKVRLLSWRLPTEESGYSLRYRKEGLLVPPNPFFERLGYLLGLKARGFSRYTPFAYQTLVLKNLSGVPLNLVVRTEFLDPATGKPVPGFYPPRFGQEGHFQRPLTLVYLPPKGRSRVVLPIYLQGVSPGEYLLRVEVSLLGEKRPLLVQTRRIGVSRGGFFLAAGLLAILILGGLFALGVLFGLRRLLGLFTLRELSLVALAGAVAFGLDFLGGLLSNILYALLGPFNILVGGLVTEVIHYTVFTAVFLLVPRPGFAILSGLLQYLMGLSLFGGLRATDPFFLGSRLLVLEAFLCLFRTHSRPSGWRTPVALSLADALNTLASLIIHMTFYRLFFPGWYLWLSIVVKGFFYTLIGARIGVRLGRTLLAAER